MRRRHRRTERASRRIAHREGGAVAAAGRAAGNGTSRVQLDVRRHVSRIVDGRARGFLVFQRELVGRRVNLAQVVDAAIGLGRRTRFDEVRDRDRRQEADDGHDDHDFNQRETGFTDVA